MKTYELTGDQLNYWVARATGLDDASVKHRRRTQPWTIQFQDWPLGGPLLDRETPVVIWHFGEEGNTCTVSIGMKLHVMSGDPVPDGTGRKGYGSGPTTLVAFCRAFVASKFGTEVPDED